jgi:hypothetical protein
VGAPVFRAWLKILIFYRQPGLVVDIRAVPTGLRHFDSSSPRVSPWAIFRLSLTGGWLWLGWRVLSLVTEGEGSFDKLRAPMFVLLEVADWGL